MELIYHSLPLADADTPKQHQEGGAYLGLLDSSPASSPSASSLERGSSFIPVASLSSTLGVLRADRVAVEQDVTGTYIVVACPEATAHGGRHARDGTLVV